MKGPISLTLVGMHTQDQEEPYSLYVTYAGHSGIVSAAAIGVFRAFRAFQTFRASGAFQAFRAIQTFSRQLLGITQNAFRTAQSALSTAQNRP